MKIRNFLNKDVLLVLLVILFLLSKYNDIVIQKWFPSQAETVVNKSKTLVILTKGYNNNDVIAVFTHNNYYINFSNCMNVIDAFKKIKTSDADSFMCIWSR